MNRTFFVFLLILSACNHPPQLTLDKRSGEMINIKDLGSKTSNDYPEITDQKFIPLETSPESIIGRVSKIIFKNNHYYIFDQRENKAVFVFSATGKFVWKISALGLGPGKYMEALDFDVSDQGDVTIWDNFGTKFITYHQDGRIDEYKCKFHLLEFKLLSNNNIAIYKPYQRGKVICFIGNYNLDSRELTLTVPGRKIFDNLSIPNFSFNALNQQPDGNVYVYERFSPTIYNISDTTVKEIAHLETNALPDESVIPQNKAQNPKFLSDTSYIKSVTNIFDNGRYCSMLLFKEKKATNLLIAHKNHKQWFFTSYPFYFLGAPQIMGVNNGAFMTVVKDADRISYAGIEKTASDEKLSPDLVNLLKSDRSKMNPIIETFKFKE